MRTHGKKTVLKFAAAVLFAAVFFTLLYFAMRGIAYPRPHLTVVRDCKTEEALAYAVMKAESGFRENAKSSAGAVGLMQLLPSTAEFVCRKYNISFDSENLTQGEFNVRVGCLYLNYLTEKFSEPGTVLAAYNAGEGTVSEWLKQADFSDDGITLKAIPYPETAKYVKKVEKFRKNYLFLYH